MALKRATDTSPPMGGIEAPASRQARRSVTKPRAWALV